jgi:hypothetical protein
VQPSNPSKQAATQPHDAPCQKQHNRGARGAQGHNVIVLGTEPDRPGCLPPTILGPAARGAGAEKMKARVVRTSGRQKTARGREQSRGWGRGVRPCMAGAQRQRQQDPWDDGTVREAGAEVRSAVALLCRRSRCLVAHSLSLSAATASAPQKGPWRGTDNHTKKAEVCDRNGALSGRVAGAASGPTICELSRVTIFRAQLHWWPPRKSVTQHLARFC